MELTETDGLSKAVERLAVVDDMTDIMQDMPPDEPQIRNYPTLQTEMYRPVMREKVLYSVDSSSFRIIVRPKCPSLIYMEFFLQKCEPLLYIF